MAPVGCWESLAAAIEAGATSVYFGIEHLNMRARSSVNFTTNDIDTIVARCREAGVKTYLTVNTVMYPEDLPLMRQIVDGAHAAGVDAVIASDIAVMQYANSIGQEVHLSTQLNIANTEALKFYAQFADVVVLARELNMEQVASIYRDIQEQHICGRSGKPIRIDVLSRCVMYGRQREMLPESEQLRPECQPRGVRTGVPSWLHGQRQVVRLGVGYRQPVCDVAQRPQDHSFPQ